MKHSCVPIEVIKINLNNNNVQTYKLNSSASLCYSNLKVEGELVLIPDSVPLNGTVVTNDNKFIKIYLFYRSGVQLPPNFGKVRHSLVFAPEKGCVIIPGEYTVPAGSFLITIIAIAAGGSGGKGGNGGNGSGKSINTAGGGGGASGSAGTPGESRCFEIRGPTTSDITLRYTVGLTCPGSSKDTVVKIDGLTPETITLVAVGGVDGKNGGNGGDATDVTGGVGGKAPNGGNDGGDGGVQALQYHVGSNGLGPTGGKGGEGNGSGGGGGGGTEGYGSEITCKIFPGKQRAPVPSSRGGNGGKGPFPFREGVAGEDAQLLPTTPCGHGCGGNGGGGGGGGGGGSSTGSGGKGGAGAPGIPGGEAVIDLEYFTMS